MTDDFATALIEAELKEKTLLTQIAKFDAQNKNYIRNDFEVKG